MSRPALLVQIRRQLHEMVLHRELLRETRIFPEGPRHEAALAIAEDEDLLARGRPAHRLGEDAGRGPRSGRQMDDVPAPRASGRPCGNGGCRCRSSAATPEVRLAVGAPRTGSCPLRRELRAAEHLGPEHAAVPGAHGNLQRRLVRLRKPQPTRVATSSRCSPAGRKSGDQERQNLSAETENGRQPDRSGGGHEPQAPQHAPAHGRGGGGFRFARRAQRQAGDGEARGAEPGEAEFERRVRPALHGEGGGAPSKKSERSPAHSSSWVKSRHARSIRFCAITSTPSMG